MNKIDEIVPEHFDSEKQQRKPRLILSEALIDLYSSHQFAASIALEIRDRYITSEGFPFCCEHLDEIPEAVCCATVDCVMACLSKPFRFNFISAEIRQMEIESKSSFSIAEVILKVDDDCCSQPLVGTAIVSGASLEDAVYSVARASLDAMNRTVAPHLEIPPDLLNQTFIQRYREYWMRSYQIRRKRRH